MDRIARLFFVGLLTATSLVATGCGNGRLFGGGGFGGGNGPFAPTDGGTGQRTPWLGGGGSNGVDTPVLGGSDQPPQPPPDLTQRPMPQAPVSFDANSQAVLQKYNATVGGPWATQDNVDIVAKSLQLYPAIRRHPLRFVIGPDANRRSLSGLWVLNGGSATIYLYEPKTRSTPPHEIAHDQTLAVQPNESRTLRGLFNRTGSNAYARGYSRSNEREFAADALSYYARRVSGLDPSVTYNPPAEVVQALQPMLIDSLRGR